MLKPDRFSCSQKIWLKWDPPVIDLYTMVVLSLTFLFAFIGTILSRVFFISSLNACTVSSRDDWSSILLMLNTCEKLFN